MALHDDFLALARQLVDQNPGSPVEADLRRGVSTAYYSLFHLLVSEAMTQLVANPSLRPMLSRVFQHNLMKRCCEEYTKLKPNAQGQRIFAGDMVPQQVLDIADAFEKLQDARHSADYDTSQPLTPVQADAEVMRAEVSFIDWDAIRNHRSASIFLAELFCRSVLRR